MAIVLFLLLVQIGGQKLAFCPAKFPKGNWDLARGSSGFEEHNFKTRDNLILHGWFFASQKPESKWVLLWCHGGQGNMTHYFDQVKLFQYHGFSVFIFDYRGYGKSEGSPSENGCYIDAMAAYNFLASEKSISPDRIVIFGQSLGGAVAANLTRHLVREKKPPRVLILESTWTSFPSTFKKTIGGHLLAPLIKSKFSVLDVVREIEIPILIIHGKKDVMVPYHHAEQLLQNAKNPKKDIFEIPGGGHNDGYLVAGFAYFKRICKFVEMQTK